MMLVDVSSLRDVMKENNISVKELANASKINESELRFLLSFDIEFISIEFHERIERALENLCKEKKENKIPSDLEGLCACPSCTGIRLFGVKQEQSKWNHSEYKRDLNKKKIDPTNMFVRKDESNEEVVTKPTPSGLNLLELNKKLSMELNKLREENKVLRNENSLLRNDVSSLSSDNEELRGLNKSLSKSLTEVNQAYTEIRNSYDSAKQAVGYLVHVINAC